MLEKESLERGVLFHRSKSHASGYRVLNALIELGYVSTFVIGPATWCKITEAGHKALG